MKAKAAFLTIAAAMAVAGTALGTAPEIGEETRETKSSIDISLVSDTDDEIDFRPGEAFKYKVQVRNDGTDPAWVFVEATIPKAEGAVLMEGTADPEVIDYELGEGWEEVETGVFFYEELLEAGKTTTELFSSTSLPEYDLEQRDGKIYTGSITLDELNEDTAGLSFTGYALQGSLDGTPEQLWSMVKGE